MSDGGGKATSPRDPSEHEAAGGGGRARGRHGGPGSSDGGTAPRVIGARGDASAGPTLVAIGALHGNEPGGARALQLVLAELERREIELAGRFVAVIGNRRALAAGRRYVQRDLNRRWFDDELRRLRREEVTADGTEDAEQRELLDCLLEAIETAQGPVTFLDLHSTSGRGSPFACMADTLRNRRVALALPVPVILGLEEVIDGTLLGWLTDLGHAGVAFEGGQHEEPSTMESHAAATWLALDAAGLLPKSESARVAESRRLLERSAEGLPELLEIRHRHVVGPDDEFVMEPGWASFQPVREGETVAVDRDGPIRAPCGGLMLLPRYQGQGEDGYFVARPVRRAWLALSGVIRRLHLERLVPLLPGVHRHAVLPDRLVVDGRVARWHVVEVMHLFGFRRRIAVGDTFVFARRRPDDLPPRRVDLGERAGDER